MGMRGFWYRFFIKGVGFGLKYPQGVWGIFCKRIRGWEWLKVERFGLLGRLGFWEMGNWGRKLLVGYEMRN